MLQQSTPEDYVIATGRTSSLEYFIELTFSACGLDWKKWVDIDTNFFRSNDLIEGRADPSKAKRFLRWSSNLTLEKIINRLVAVELGKISIIES
jgi:GDPmannose 4,6-dehydratase